MSAAGKLLQVEVIVKRTTYLVNDRFSARSRVPAHLQMWFDARATVSGFGSMPVRSGHLADRVLVLGNRSVVFR
jgi:hypothetical protein